MPKVTVMMKGELQELGEDVEGIESISKIQTQILNLTKGRVNIFDDNGSFRATYDILKDISEIYNELSDPDKANLTEIIFGKLRSNQGLAIISAFQSGQIEKALRDSQSAAGTATEEMLRYSESIQAHLNQFKETVQELSADAIDAGFIKDVIDDGITLLTLLDDIIKALKEIKDIIPQSLKDAYEFLNDNPLINPLKGILNIAQEGDGLYKELFGGGSEAVQELNKMSSGLESVIDKYIEYNSTGVDSESITAKLNAEVKNINEAYAENGERIDLVNKSLAENLSLMRQAEKKKTGEWLKENAEDYQKAVEALEYVDTVDEKGRAPFTYTMNAKGVSRYTQKQYDAFLNLGLDNYVSGQGTGFSYDFALTGTLEEQLESLQKIRDVYVTLDDMEEDRLKQFDAEIDKLKGKIDTYKNLVSTFEDYKKQYESMQNLTAQEYNMIEQAINAYQEYQNAKLADDSEGEKAALNTLNNIKDIVYSISDPSSTLRQDFDSMWDKFVLGEVEAMSNLEQLQEDFAELTNKTFSEELKNIDSIQSAIESMLNDETLSHDDAWNIINLDAEGILKDIQLINGQYKFSTDQLVALIQQRINKQREEIQITKESAQANLAAAEAKLFNMKINSAADVKAYAGEIEKIKNDIKTAKIILTQSDYLLGELNGKLAQTELLTSNTAKQLNASIQAFEDELEAIDDTIDSLNKRKDALNEEKEALNDQLDLLKEQQKEIENQQKALKNVVDKYLKRYEDSMKSQLDAIKQQKDEIKDEYDERIKALKNENEERDIAYKKEKALLDLNKAKSQQVRTYSSARGWSYGASKEKVVEAQKNLDDVLLEEQINNLEKERDEVIKPLEDQEKAYEKEIKAFEDYAKKYEIAADEIEEADEALLAEKLLGSNWREEIEKKDEGLLSSYKREYGNFARELERLTKTEIKNIEASIKAKEDEIRTIGDEITAYNNYKSTVQKNLKDAQDALDSYKGKVETAKNDIVGAMGNMETETFYKTNGCKDLWNELANSVEESKNRVTGYCAEMINAADRLRQELGSGVSSGALALINMASGLRGYSSGGVIDYTGLAKVHGSKSSSETAFNASDSKKLYDMVHNTPNLIASIVKQASNISGFNPSNITKNSNTTSSVNVNIGQVVANNPQQFTANLDTHLDSYFRRKLTQGFVQ